MCGIAGYIGSRFISDEVADTCLRKMHRRGPDGNGVYRHSLREGQNFLLLHSRLSIIDHSSNASQPMQHEHLVMSFNGELYNYLELRKELENKGYAFSTHSDSEVLLKSFHASGIYSFEKMEGMWGLAVYDESDGTLHLSRDRFGEKPLYMYEDGTGLYFGSEIKYIFQLVGKKISINYDQLLRYLIYGYKFIYKHSTSFYEGVTEHPSGSYSVWGAEGKRHTNRFSQVRTVQESDMTRDEAVQGVRDRLIRSMELRLRADVPLAFCMSGGVDSNALISIAKKVFGYDVHGFTVVNTDERYAEQELVNKSVNKLGLKHTEIPVTTSDFLPKLKKLVQQHDAPVYTISYYAHWQLMASVAEHGYKVSISGTGADELFTGYYDHYNLYLASCSKNKELYSTALVDWTNHIKPIVRNPILQDPNVFIDQPQTRGHLHLGSGEFKEYMHRDLAFTYSEESYSRDLLRNRMLNEMFYEVVPVILHEDDMNAMYYSIENRSPFLDCSLFDYCNTIPTKHLIHDGYNKSILREAMRGIVPDPILDDRKKIGFNAPIKSFLNVDDPHVRDVIYEDSPVFDLVKIKCIKGLIEKTKKSNKYSKFLFNFLCSKLFLELH